MNPELATLHLDRVSDVTVASVSGEIDLSNAREIGRRLRDASSQRALVIDVSPLDYLDSAGIAMLHDLVQEIGEDRVCLVVAPDARVRRALDVAGVEAIIRVEQSLDRAVASLAS